MRRTTNTMREDVRDRCCYGSQPAGSTGRKQALAALLFWAIVPAGCAHNVATKATASATSSPAIVPTEVASAAPSTAASGRPAAPEVPASGAPRATAPGVRHAVNATPSASPAPQIYSVRASPAIVHDGQSVVWDVRTTPDVVSVNAHVAAVTLQLQRLSPGHFGLTFALPQGVPGFFHGTYQLDVRALAGDGETLHHGISLVFQ